MINKFQQGGLASQEQQVVMLFVLALAQVLQTEPELVVEYALKNPKALQLAFQVFQLTLDIKLAAQVFAGSAQKARHGAKLNYVKALKNMCAEDEELVRYANGGCLCLKKKMQEGGEVKKKDPVSRFKNRKLTEEKCGGKMKKKSKGGKAPYDVDVLAPLKTKKK